MKRFITMCMFFVLLSSSFVWSDEGNEPQAEEVLSITMRTSSEKEAELERVIAVLKQAGIITDVQYLETLPMTYRFKTRSLYWVALLDLAYEYDPQIPIEGIFSIELIATKDSDAELKEALDILKKADVIQDLEIVASSPSRYKLKTASPHWAKILKNGYGTKKVVSMSFFPQSQQEDAMLQDALQKLLNEKLVVDVAWPKCFPGEYTVGTNKVSVLRLLNAVFPAESIAELQEDSSLNQEPNQNEDSDALHLGSDEATITSYLLSHLVEDEVILSYGLSFVISIDEDGEGAVCLAEYSVEGASETVSMLLNQKLDFSILRKWYPGEEVEIEDEDEDYDSFPCDEEEDSGN